MSSFIEEKSLIRLISQGDPKAFSQVYDRYKPVLYRLVFNTLKSADLTNDTCQEIFIKIWEDRSRLEDIISFKYYLLSVGKNHTLNVLKKILHEQKRLSTFVRDYNDVNNELEEKVESDEYQEFIDSVLTSLTPQSRKIFSLCRFQGMSYDEAAQMVGVSRNIIKKHMVKTMKVFKAAVEKDLGIAVNMLSAFAFFTSD
ncbi:RNA polymerase sigma factor [Dyadobacter frigoris]|uniref:Sigma-70 family RNA polymerase sigma factor n=1 Tax=Dyadobacter frigoris TaxID=2576211 RepID=A0A4U6CS73_9BACT|nr:sigma-70 family RNA polymerase sigma factor [Dyadobacter frigoris]TKT87036.1 sigma-70 family RNA polymerase sigma factor [Dyadobacter frigoris]GLU52765.1 DNA-directed RNA polymerase sigma-70 factor [Dyadobacter frigoris]